VLCSLVNVIKQALWKLNHVFSWRIVCFSLNVPKEREKKDNYIFQFEHVTLNKKSRESSFSEKKVIMFIYSLKQIMSKYVGEWLSRSNNQIMELTNVWMFEYKQQRPNNNNISEFFFSNMKGRLIQYLYLECSVVLEKSRPFLTSANNCEFNKSFFFLV
jgi:hypothetical protein